MEGGATVGATVPQQSTLCHSTLWVPPGQSTTCHSTEGGGALCHSKAHTVPEGLWAVKGRGVAWHGIALRASRCWAARQWVAWCRAGGARSCEGGGLARRKGRYWTSLWSGSPLPGVPHRTGVPLQVHPLSMLGFAASMVGFAASVVFRSVLSMVGLAHLSMVTPAPWSGPH